MKCTWEKDDIRGGLFIIRDTGITPTPRSTVLQIGWTQTRGNLSAEYGFIDIFTDGMLRIIGTKEDLANYLNSQGSNYRPLSKEEMLRLVERNFKGIF